ncbi:MAG: hypothetical protein AAB565_00630 [Patescibacteria group bacterium]
MNEQTQDSKSLESESSEIKPKRGYIVPISFLISFLIIAGAFSYNNGFQLPQKKQTKIHSSSKKEVTANSLPSLDEKSLKELEEKVLPPEGMVLPIVWGDLGAKMIDSGVIDGAKFEQLYTNRGGLDNETKNLLYGKNNGNLKINSENSGTILNLLWALGLGTKNDILEKGPMNDKKYNGAENFASTGGWTLAKGEAMNYYSKYPFIILTPEQQSLLERVSKNIYRSCCNNSTYFPDCNHGMAMLALLELMASQNVSENEMYQVALKINSFWFPDTYLTIAQYLKLKKSIEWEKVDPKEILGAEYSSASGYQKILSQVTPPEQGSSGSCGV